MITESSHGLALGGIFIMLMFAAIALAGFVFWLWMLIHAIQNRGLDGSERIVWIIVIVFVNLVGAIIYFFVGRPKASAASAKTPPSSQPPSMP
jgi:hypothetical protein